MTAPFKREGARQEYEDTWGQVLSMVDREIGRGVDSPHDIVDRVTVELLEKTWTSSAFRGYYERLGIDCDSAGSPVERIAVRDGAYRRVPFHDPTDRMPVVSILLNYLRLQSDQVRCIVELGSGFGRNLLGLHDALIERSSVPVEFHACELTSAGREATERFRRLDGNIDLTVHPFDYHEPDLSFLEGRKDVLFFTAHSIEQVPELSQSVIDEMLARTKRCRCVHFEPVGWQYDERLVRWRRSIDGAGGLRRWIQKRPHRLARAIDRVAGTRLAREFPGIDLSPRDIGSSDGVSRNAARWSRRLCYNRNLVKLLRSTAAGGKIRIERERINLFGGNPFNPTTLICWESAQA